MSTERLEFAAPASSGHTLHRAIRWPQAFWLASGVPALVLCLGQGHLLDNPR